MKVITVWQPWASLIAVDAKSFEFRGRRAPANAVNQRIGIHAAKRPVERFEIQTIIEKIKQDGGECIGLNAERAVRLLEYSLVYPSALPFSSIICTAFLGRADRSAGRFDTGFVDTWAWPLSKIEVLDPVVEARGHQGFWTWDHSSYAERQAS